MSTPQDRILHAAIAKTRQTIQDVSLTDPQAFALAVLADFAESQVDPKRVLSLDRLKKDFRVLVSSDEQIHPI
jgi:hypothetical protein